MFKKFGYNEQLHITSSLLLVVSGTQSKIQYQCSTKATFVSYYPVFEHQIRGTTRTYSWLLIHF